MQKASPGCTSARWNAALPRLCREEPARCLSQGLPAPASACSWASAKGAAQPALSARRRTWLRCLAASFPAFAPRASCLPRGSSPGSESARPREPGSQDGSGNRPELAKPAGRARVGSPGTAGREAVRAGGGPPGAAGRPWRASSAHSDAPRRWRRRRVEIRALPGRGSGCPAGPCCLGVRRQKPLNSDDDLSSFHAAQPPLLFQEERVGGRRKLFALGA